MPKVSTSFTLPEPTKRQIDELKEIYGSDRMVVMVAIERLYQQVISLKLSRDLTLKDSDAATLAFVAVRGVLFEIGDLIETHFEEGGGEMRYSDATALLRLILALAKEGAMD